MTFRPDVIIYHYPCSDGGASAALLADFYNNDSAIQWIRGTYSNTGLLDEIVAACAGKRVLFADFSLKADAMQHLLTVADTVVVLDHHDSALREFAKLGKQVIRDPVDDPEFGVNNGVARGLTAWMRMDMSGVGLTFRWLYGFDVPMPRAVAWTQDIDLGRELTPDHRAFKWYTRSFSPAVEDLFAMNYGEQLLERHHDNSALMLDQGRAVQRFANLCVDQYVREAHVVDYQFGDVRYTIPTAFASYAFASDVANALIFKLDNGAHNIGVCVYFDGNGLGLSLRSKNGVECNVVAETLGGGGHKQAAGANIPWNDVVEFVQGVIANLEVKTSDDS